MASVESFRQNNFTADLASTFLAGSPQEEYWLGLQAYNQLQTNTLEADAGHQVCLLFLILFFVSCLFTLFVYFLVHRSLSIMVIGPKNTLILFKEIVSNPYSKHIPTGILHNLFTLSIVHIVNSLFTFFVYFF